MDRRILFTIIVAALGYFVDVYDLIIFSVVRVQSLTDLGISGDALTQDGVWLLNMQMGGMLLGGIFWGVLGDRRGRLSILFGSIVLYSLANIANAFVTTVGQYALCRFIAGFGLAGEIGAGITLVAELLPKDKRGLGTTLVATLGLMGGFVAALTGGMLAWKTAYLLGGGMGLGLLALRVAAAESDLFAHIAQDSTARRGDLRLLLASPARLWRFLRCTLIGLPVWYMAGLIVTFAPEIGTSLGIPEPLNPGRGVLWLYGGIVLGDLASGLISQFLKSRRRALALFLTGTGLGVMTILNLPAAWQTAGAYYMLCGVTGFFTGYWAIFLVTTAENFGTNLRATVTTMAPNLVRGGAILLSTSFAWLKPVMGVTPSLELLGALTIGGAIAAALSLRETFGTDLDYVEN